MYQGSRGKVRVDRRVGAHPREGAQPRIVGGDSGKSSARFPTSERWAMNMPKARGKEERHPAPEVVAEDLFADQAAAEKRHEDVDQCR